MGAIVTNIVERIERFFESKRREKVSALAVRKRMRLHALFNRVTESMLGNMTLPWGADQRDPQILCDVMCVNRVNLH